MRPARCIAALCLLVLAIPGAAVADIELRTAASLDVRVAKPLTIGFEEELRVDMRPGEPRSWLQSVELKIQPIKGLRIAPQYRFARYMRARGEATELRHRLAVALRGRFKLGPVRLGLRERYQVRIGEPGSTPRQHLVSKVDARVRHEALPFEPSLWLEFFLRLPEDEDTVLADKIRVGLGVSMPAGLCDVDIEFQVEKSIKNLEEAAVPIFAINFEFELDARPKKD